MQSYPPPPPPPPVASTVSSAATPAPPLTQLQQDFPQTRDLSREDLQDLVNDPAYFQAFLYSLPPVKDRLAQIEEVSKRNEEIAQTNLALQAPLDQLRSETLAAFANANELKARWAQVEKEQASLYQRFDQSFLHLRLRHSLGEQDDLSETLASSFIDGSSSRSGSPAPTAAENNKALDEFVRDFRTSRKQYHKRAVWAERWGRGEVSWRED